MRRFCLLVLLFAFPFAPRAAADPARKVGDLYLLGYGVDQGGAARGELAQVGKAGILKHVRLGAVLQGRLYAVETDGTLQATGLATGTRAPLGSADFKDAAFLVAAGGRLYAVAKGGGLFRVNPADGGRARIGTDGAWRAVRAAAVLKGLLYSAETDGTLRATDLATGTRKQVGKSDFKDTSLLFAADDHLYAVEKGGGLFRVNPADGARARVGRPDAWKAVRAGAVLKGRLHTIETDGTLRTTDLATGMRARVGRGPAFGDVALLFAAGESLYTLRDNGNLFSVNVNPRPVVDQYNFMPLGFEKVFREQGQAFYRHMRSRQVLGQFATHAELMDGLAWLRRHATADDLVLMFVACHGSCNARGESVFSTIDGVIVRPRDIKKELAQLPCQAIYVDDACQSGGWPKDLPGDPLPPNVTALCCCLETQSSNNEFDVALFEALHGRADFNKDGVVDLDEVIRYCALRVKEIQGGRLTPVLRKAKGLRSVLPLTKVAPNLVSVVARGEVYSALLGKRDGDRYPVYLIGWDTKPGMPYFVTSAVKRDYLCLPGDGPPLRVEQKGRWFPARLLGSVGEDYKIRYLGAKHGEEVVKDERVRPLFSAKPGALGRSYRYSAACAAALAAAGKGQGGAGPTAAERARLRTQALAWLQAELAARARLLERDRFAAARIHEDMRYWQDDPDLAGLRDNGDLARYSGEERAAWSGFWGRVAGLGKQAGDSYTQTERRGRLGPEGRERSYRIDMAAGKTYVIDMTSPQFDTYLRLHDDEGEVVAENDNISKDDRNSRLVFTPPGAGTYRVVATSFLQRGRGAYTLTIRAFAAKKN